MPKTLAFAGSARTDSFNKKLISLAARKAQERGAEVTLVDLRDFPMPIYDGDVEDSDGLPANAVKLRQMMSEHDGLLLACPEYNGSITPLLKNTIDWTSRPSNGIPMVAAYAGKVAALMSASPGVLGGMRGLVHVRAILSGIGVHVVPKEASLGGAHSVFGEDGSLTDDRLDKRLDGLVAAYVETLNKLKV